MKPKKFVRIVIDKYKKFEGVFSKHKNAEDLAPKTDNISKALYLFYVIQLDYATKSQRLYKGALILFNKNPEFYNPDYILKLSEDKLKQFLVDYLKPRYINEATLRFKQNSKRLKAEYKNNPLLIFKKSKTAKTALKRVLEFRGFGPKIGNFFVRTMVNTFNLDYPDIENILPPVDIHDVRIAYLMGFIKSDRMSQKNINLTKNIWSNACKKAGVSWLTFDKALWLLGSEGKPKSKEDIFHLLNI